MKFIGNRWLHLIIFFIVLPDVYAQQINSSIGDTLHYVEAPAIPLEFHKKHLYAPSLLLLSGITLNSNKSGSIKHQVVNMRSMHLPNFKTGIDDYLQYTPIALSYGLDVFGIESKTNFADRTAMLLKAELLMTGTVFAIKRTVGQLRPDGRAYNSFPSGHTAQAFVAATFLSEEYKDRFKWMPYIAYSIAGSVGLLRMANNRHYVSDVLFGAGLGILSVKVSYWTHQYKWGAK